MWLRFPRISETFPDFRVLRRVVLESRPPALPKQHDPRFRSLCILHVCGAPLATNKRPSSAMAIWACISKGKSVNACRDSKFSTRKGRLVSSYVMCVKLAIGTMIPCSVAVINREASDETHALVDQQMAAAHSIRRPERTRKETHRMRRPLPSPARFAGRCPRMCVFRTTLSPALARSSHNDIPQASFHTMPRIGGLPMSRLKKFRSASGRGGPPAADDDAEGRIARACAAAASTRCWAIFCRTLSRTCADPTRPAGRPRRRACCPDVGGCAINRRMSSSPLLVPSLDSAQSSMGLDFVLGRGGRTQAQFLQLSLPEQNTSAEYVSTCARYCYTTDAWERQP